MVARVEQTVGAEGGTVALDGAEIVVPVGALDRDVEVAIVETTAVVPGLVALSPVFRFEPAGLTFARPVRVSIRYDEGVLVPNAYWSLPDEPDRVEPVRAALRGGTGRGTATFEVRHFSTGLVAAVDPCEAGEVVVAEETVVQEGPAPWLERRGFAAEAAGMLCVEVQRRVDAKVAVTLDQEPLLAVADCGGEPCLCDINDPECGCGGVPCVCDGNDPQCGGGGEPWITGLAAALPGEHALEVLLEALPGAEVGVRARLARFQAVDVQLGPRRKVSVSEPFVSPAVISPWDADGLADSARLSAAVVVENLPRDRDVLRYELRYAWHIGRDGTGEEIAALEGGGAWDPWCLKCVMPYPPQARATWDGRDTAGALVMPGVYTVRVKVEVVKVVPPAREVVIDIVESVERTVGVTLTRGPELDLRLVDAVKRNVPGGETHVSDGDVYTTPAPSLMVVGRFDDARLVRSVRIAAGAGHEYVPQVDASGVFRQGLPLAGDAHGSVSEAWTVEVTDIAGTTRATSFTVRQVGLPSMLVPSAVLAPAVVPGGGTGELRVEVESLSDAAESLALRVTLPAGIRWSGGAVSAEDAAGSRIVAVESADLPMGQRLIAREQVAMEGRVVLHIPIVVQVGLDERAVAVDVVVVAVGDDDRPSGAMGSADVWLSLGSGGARVTTADGAKALDAALVAAALASDGIVLEGPHNGPATGNVVLGATFDTTSLAGLVPALLRPVEPVAPSDPFSSDYVLVQRWEALATPAVLRSLPPPSSALDVAPLVDTP